LWKPSRVDKYLRRTRFKIYFTVLVQYIAKLDFSYPTRASKSDRFRQFQPFHLLKKDWKIKLKSSMARIFASPVIKLNLEWDRNSTDQGYYISINFSLLLICKQRNICATAWENIFCLWQNQRNWTPQMTALMQIKISK
jgi:hypothetical protein